MRPVDAGLQKLFAEIPEARELAEKSAGDLVFPGIVKAGLVAGVAGGKGALRVDGETAGYYRSRAASCGLQAGIETFGYALFLIGEADLKSLQENRGDFAVGLSPLLVIADRAHSQIVATRHPASSSAPGTARSRAMLAPNFACQNSAPSFPCTVASGNGMTP